MVAFLLNHVMPVVRSRLHLFQTSLLFYVVNLHPLIIPPMLGNFMGNLALNFVISASEENEMEVLRLMDTSSRDGIEAMVTLEECVMSLLKCDVEHASSTPNDKRTF
ncbi:hypothetical protein ACH5RR_003357 [Cinchona calisaya]|uniref:Uncharacterized protein n=1 Tax=Cinchona calisaya TaxID=153742 RepID=A0ABD3AUL4_9GENT